MEDKKPPMEPSAALALIQAAEKTTGDPLLDLIVGTQAERMRQAASILNLEWNGAYNENHVRALALAYREARKLLRDKAAAEVQEMPQEEKKTIA